jgi:hypothetical protein
MTRSFLSLRGVLLVMLLASLDQTIVGTALVKRQRRLGLCRCRGPTALPAAAPQLNLL